MIRPATPEDVPAVVEMIRELAVYQRAGHEATATEEQIGQALFGDRPAAFAHIVEVDGTAEGFALWFLNFSTWQGVHGIHLEDLYVRPRTRGAGHGKALLVELARLCAERGYGRLDWSVLDWNTPSIAFYKALDALPMSGLTGFRLTDDALARLGR